MCQIFLLPNKEHGKPIPSVNSSCVLGWIRLERLVEIRKLLFVRSLMALNPDDPSRSIFCSRVNDFLGDRVASMMNQHGSIVFDILQVAITFGVLDEVTNMVRRGHVWSKYEWRKKIWEKARDLDACVWRVNERCYHNLDLLSGVCEHSECLIWWEIANNDYSMLNRCETIVKILSHSSMLRMDDVRLKGRPIAERFCTSCDLAAPEDARHFIMECPKLQALRSCMFDRLSSINDGSGQAILASQCDILLVLLGRPVRGFSDDQMVKFWCISATHITLMYNERLREGIG